MGWFTAIGTGVGAYYGGPQGAAAGAAVGSAIDGVRAQEQANEQNKSEAQKQRNFQEWMSNTAHYREMEDMQRAGLNPTMSAGGSGASTPSGAAADIKAPMIASPEVFFNAVQLSQEQQKIDLAKQATAADISKKLTDQQLTRMKTILAGKGMPRAMLEGEAAKVMGNVINWMKNSIRSPKMPNKQ